MNSFLLFFKGNTKGAVSKVLFVKNHFSNFNKNEEEYKEAALLRQPLLCFIKISKLLNGRTKKFKDAYNELY
jgi:hypothetical protein